MLEKVNCVKYLSSIIHDINLFNLNNKKINLWIAYFVNYISQDLTLTIFSECIFDLQDA